MSAIVDVLPSKDNVPALLLMAICDEVDIPAGRFSTEGE